MKQRTRKHMTMHKALHPRDDVDRPICIKKGRRNKIASTEDSVDASIQRLEECNEKHEGGLIAATGNDTENTIPNRTTITRKQGGASGVMVIVVGIRHDDTSSNPGRD